MTEPPSAPIQFAQDWQLYFIENKDNCASRFVDWISANTHSFDSTEGAKHGYRQTASRTQAYLMPLVVATAFLQETAALACELGRRCTFKEGHESISDSLTTISKLVIAFFTTLIADICCLPLYDPRVYERKKEEPPPLPRSSLETLQAVPKLAKFCFAEANQALQGSGVTLFLSENKQVAYHSGGEVESYLWAPIDFESVLESSQGEPIYKRQAVAFKKPQIGEHLEEFLYPRGTFGATLKEVSCSGALPNVLEKGDNISALIFDNCTDIDFLERLDLTGRATKKACSTLRVLSIRGLTEISAEAIATIAGKFPKLAAIDLRNVNVVGGLDGEFLKQYIVVSNNINNAQQHLDFVNDSFANAIQTFTAGDCRDCKPIVNLFCTIDATGKVTDFPRLSPAVCFIGNFSCLRGLPIGGNDLMNIFRGMKEHFHGLTHLDLSKNPDFRVTHLAKINELHLHTLKIRDCENAFKLDDESQYEMFINGLQALFANGLRELDIQFIHSNTVSRKVFQELCPFIRDHVVHLTKTPRSLYFSQSQRDGGFLDDAEISFKPLAF